MRASTWSPAACACWAAARTSQVTHCVFQHVHKGVRLKAVGRRDAIDQVAVDDNVFSDADSGGVELPTARPMGTWPRPWAGFTMFA